MKNKLFASLLSKEKKLNSCPEFATQDLFIMAVTAIFIIKSNGRLWL
jgi:hypothetical protein